MIIALWDFLFTRRVWTIISKEPYYDITVEKTLGIVAYHYVLQDQFGNIKRKRV